MTPDDLNKAVNGDFAAFSLLLNQPHRAIEQCRQTLPNLILTADGLRQVLLALLEHRIDEGSVQKWASFVRRGYVAKAFKDPVAPIVIDYDSSAEELIAEIIARLDEIGDEIDGVVTDVEIAKWLDLLPKGTTDQIA